MIPVIKRKQKIKIKRTMDDLVLPAAYREKGCEEALIFNDGVLTVARGECITEASFMSTYKSDHSCFKPRDGYFELFFTMLLHSCNWPENKVRQLYSSIKTGYKGITRTYKDNGRRGSIEFGFEMKNHFKYGVTGYLKFNDVTDDVEGHYIYSLQIKDESMMHGAGPDIIRHVFYGRTSIQLTNAIYRSNVDKKQLISPMGIVLSDNQVYAFALKKKKEETEGQKDDNTTLRYITCAGKLQSENNNITITWNDVADVLLKPEEELLSFVALPGISDSYIFLGYINVSKDRRLRGKVFSFQPDGRFNLVNNIVETLETDGPVEILKFDPLSGKKLSNGRLVVGGWIQRVVRENKQTVKSKFSGSSYSRDVENQSFEYEPFVMWTDDEMNWNLGKKLKIEEAENNMRIQVTETGNGKEVVVIISSLDSKNVLYEGFSNDYCKTFTEIKEDWDCKMPVVSFVLSADGSLVCASSMENVKKEEESVHLEQDTTNEEVIALKRIEHHTESSDRRIEHHTESSDMPVASKVEGSSSQIQARSTWEGLWHLEQDTTTGNAIRLRPVKHDTGSSNRPNDFNTILENGSKVQCEQIVPFTRKDKSLFLMIYTTNYIYDEEDKQDHSWCTRYHVFSLDKIMCGL